MKRLQIFLKAIKIKTRTMSKKKVERPQAQSSPKNSRKACLCEDNTYSTKCCKGTIRNQGIGNI